MWLTGLSGAGKTTIARALHAALEGEGVQSYLLDGDVLRSGLNRDLGFTLEERTENIRRSAEVARLMADAGLVVIAAFISPLKLHRRMARALVKPGEFFEVFVNTPLELAERRDPKGLYAKARRGEIPDFTGIHSPYEVPDEPELVIDTTRCSAQEAAVRICDLLRTAGIVQSSRKAQRG